jgi:hypothetical protein
MVTQLPHFRQLSLPSLCLYLGHSKYVMRNCDGAIAAQAALFNCTTIATVESGVVAIEAPLPRVRAKHCTRPATALDVPAG